MYHTFTTCCLFGLATLSIIGCGGQSVSPPPDGELNYPVNAPSRTSDNADLTEGSSASDRDDPAPDGDGSSPGSGAPNSDDPSSQNLLEDNFGFEAGVGNWTAFGDASLDSSTDAPHAGERCLLVSNRAEAWSGPFLDLTSIVEPGQTYEITAWVRLNERSTASPESIRMTTRTICDAGGEDYRALAQVSLSTDWASLTGELSVDYRCEIESIGVFLEGPAPDVAFCADDVGLRLLP